MRTAMLGACNDRADAHGSPYDLAVQPTGDIAWNEPVWGMVVARFRRTLEALDIVRVWFWLLYVIEPGVIYALIAIVCVLYAEFATDGAIALPFEGMLLPFYALLAYPALCIAMAAFLSVSSPRIRVTARGVCFGLPEPAGVHADRIMRAEVLATRGGRARLRVRYWKRRRGARKPVERSVDIGIAAGVDLRALRECIEAWQRRPA